MRSITVTVGHGGEVTLPPEVLERLGMGEGDEIAFVMDGEDIHLRPKRDQDKETEDEVSDLTA